MHIPILQYQAGSSNSTRLRVQCPLCDAPPSRDDNARHHLYSVHNNVRKDHLDVLWRSAREQAKAERDIKKTAPQECDNCGGRFAYLAKHVKHCKGKSSKHKSFPSTSSCASSKYTTAESSTQSDKVATESKSTQCWLFPLEYSAINMPPPPPLPHPIVVNSNSESAPSAMESSTSFLSSCSDVQLDDSMAEEHPPSEPLQASGNTSSSASFKTRVSGGVNFFALQMSGFEEYEFDLEGGNKNRSSERDVKNFKKLCIVVSNIRRRLQSYLQYKSMVDLRHFVTHVDVIKTKILDAQHLKINSVSTYLSHIRHVLRYIKLTQQSNSTSDYSTLFEPLSLDQVEVADGRYKCMKAAAKRGVRKYTALQKPKIQSLLISPEELDKVKPLYQALISDIAAVAATSSSSKSTLSPEFSSIRDRLLLLCMLEMPLRITPYLHLKVEHLLPSPSGSSGSNNLLSFSSDNTAVLIKLPDIEHKCETSCGILELVFSIKLYNLLISFSKAFKFTSDSYIFPSNSLKPYKTTASLSANIFRITKSILGRSVGPCVIRKFIVTTLRSKYPLLSKNAAEFLQHSEFVANAHYMAAQSDVNKFAVGKAIVESLNLF